MGYLQYSAFRSVLKAITARVRFTQEIPAGGYLQVVEGDKVVKSFPFDSSFAMALSGKDSAYDAALGRTYDPKKFALLYRRESTLEVEYVIAPIG